MQHGRALLVFCVVALVGCGSNDDATSAVDGGPASACAEPVSDPPAWKAARTDATAIRVVTTDDARSRLIAELQAYVQQTNPELTPQSKSRIVELLADDARIEVWVEPDTCDTWTMAEVAKDSIASEVVFLQLNEQFARDIPRFRDLGADPRKSDELRSGYLTTALLLLESIDTRYLVRTLAVNYERELIQSKLDELGQTFSADFEALLEQGLRSNSVDAAERTRLSLVAFDGIDAATKADGLKRMDQLIAKLRSKALRAEIDAIHQRALISDYAAAESASAMLAGFADGEEAERAQRLGAELRQRAATLRAREIESGLSELESGVPIASEIAAIAGRVDAFAGAYGESSAYSGWRDRLTALRETIQAEVLEDEVAEADTAEDAAVVAPRPDCAATAELDTFTSFQFDNRDLGYAGARTHKLLVDTISSQITMTNPTDLPIRVLGVSQQLVDAQGRVLSSGSLNDPVQIAVAQSYAAAIDLPFDNENPAAVACMGPLARRAHACSMVVVTNVQIDAGDACLQRTVAHTERVQFESVHMPNKYTIKLWRDD